MRRERGASGERGAPAAVERDREKSVRKEKAERTEIFPIALCISTLFKHAFHV
jgi:hypothetical protein